MVEGGSSRDFSYVKEMLYSRPELLEEVLDINVKAVAAYLAAQVESGAQALQIFDTWGGSLTEAAFKRFSLRPIRLVIEHLRKTLGEKSVPIIVFTKGGGNWLEDLSQCGADCIGVDWTVNLAKGRARTKDAVALQGNMDPAVLLSTEAAVEKEACRVLEEFGQVGAGAGHVFNLGHGVLQQTSPEVVKTLVDVVHSVSARYHV
jgi:uroporphyrinogen decarboxylase